MIRALLLVLALVTTSTAVLNTGPARPASFTCPGPATVHPGPATPGGCSTVTTTTTTSVTSSTVLSSILPSTVGADTNCAGATSPVVNSASVSGWANYVVHSKTCSTGANATGYDVTAVSVAIGSASAGAKLKCSVYDNAFPHVHVAAGCDTVEATLGANPNAYTTLTTTGACHVAAGTRYQISCATDSAATTWGQVNTACAQCFQYSGGGITYASLWPATLGPGAGYDVTLASYLTAAPSP